MTLFIDLGCLYCKQTQREFIVWNCSQDAGMPGTESQCVFTAGGERVKCTKNRKKNAPTNLFKSNKNKNNNNIYIDRCLKISNKTTIIHLHCVPINHSMFNSVPNEFNNQQQNKLQ
jgi:hypothetical protein